MKYCTKCGTQLADDALFCSKCGAKVAEEVTPNTEVKKEEPVVKQQPVKQARRFSTYFGKEIG